MRARDDQRMSFDRRSVVAFFDSSMFSETLGEDNEFWNFGLWRAGTSSHRQASENLMEELLAAIPDKKGRILDVACGRGATTRYLLRFYASSQVLGINISPKQLVMCRRIAPSCTFLLMDAADLAFEDRSLDAIICVEAAFHFNTREKFLAEAYRVLRPGGRLVMSDILLARTLVRMTPAVPDENYVATPSGYRALYTTVGFGGVKIRDVTAETWLAWRRHVFIRMSRCFWERYGIRGLLHWWAWITLMMIGVRKYLLVSAAKT